MITILILVQVSADGPRNLDEKRKNSDDIKAWNIYLVSYG